MELDKITSPSDLRSLDAKRLATLAAEIRTFIVNAVAETGGHLGSNLGAVELTLALHRVFDSPRDVMLWDTGHQAYVHKIVTGRRDQFGKLRQEDGLSGYPSRAESEHDWIENSHASTVLSYAQGIAISLEQRNQPERRVVAVIGDGAMTGGMAYEALNNIGHAQTRCVIILNDNGRSYAPTVSRLSTSLTKLRLHPSYLAARDRVEATVRDLPGVGEWANKSIQSVKAAVREYVEPHTFFEALGVRYTGPIDGHDIAGMEEAFRYAATYEGPIVVHVLTQKGRGYSPAEDDDEKNLHDAPVFDPHFGPEKWQPTGYTKAFSDAAIRAAELDPNVVAITAAMPGPTGLIPFQERFPSRFFDVGIAEQHAVTFAAGLAMGGMHPIVAIYSTFFCRAFDQTVYDVALHDLPVVFALDRAGITGDDGASTQGVLDLALAMSIPGMTVFAPSSAEEVGAMLQTAMTLDSPATIRFPKGLARHVTPEEVGDGFSARKAVRGDGSLCMLSVGRMLEACEDAAKILGDHDISATVWDVRVAKPLDLSMIADALQHDHIITVEDGIRVGGVGSAIIDALNVQAAVSGKAVPPVVTLGVPSAFIPQAKPAAILSRLGLDGPGIAESARAALLSTSTKTE